jgi:tetratricopeptide (TPR) repeat protein
MKIELLYKIYNHSLELARIYKKENNLDLAEKMYLICNFVSPHNAELLNEMSNFYWENNEMEKGFNFATKAFNFANNNKERFLVNAAIIAADLGKNQDAIALYKEALKINPNLARAKFGLAVENIKKGNLKNGWHLYLNRHEAFNTDNFIDENISKLPTWDGQSKDSVLIYNEQGYGDFIFAMRYLPFLKDHKYFVFTDRNIQPLFEMAGIPCTAELPVEHKLKKCSILDLPALLNKNLYYSNVYRKLFKQHTKKEKIIKKIGLVFSGSSNYSADKKRSIYLSAFKKINKIKNLKLVLLQKDIEKNSYFDAKIGNKSFCDSLTTFRDTANVLYELDGLITVDTAVAHLGGALGIPTFILLNKFPDFRWQKEQGQKWYPSWKQYLQVTEGCWKEPFHRLHNDLIDFSKS